MSRIGSDPDSFKNEIAKALDEGYTLDGIAIMKGPGGALRWIFLNPESTSMNLVGMLEWIKMQLFSNHENGIGRHLGGGTKPR